MKKIILTVTIFLFFCVFSSKSALASLNISLSDLPSFVNKTNIKLYYTYLNTSGNPATVNLYIQKDGKDYRQTVEKDKTNVSGYFELRALDFYDGEGKYNFSATAVFGADSATDTTATNLDTSAPSAPTEYSKERLNQTTYKLSWKNSFDDDFEKVYIYRSKETSFTADSSTKIGEAGGSKNEKMTFNDGSVQLDVTYYYALRAIDHAGNISGITTDAPGTMITVTVTGVKATSSPRKTTYLSVTPAVVKKEGEVNGGVSDEGVTEEGKTTNFILKSKNSLFILAGGVILILAYIIYRRRK